MEVFDGLNTMEKYCLQFLLNVYSVNIQTSLSHTSHFHVSEKPIIKPIILGHSHNY